MLVPPKNLDLLPLFKDGEFDDDARRAELVAGVGVEVEEHSGALVCTGVKVDVELVRLDLGADRHRLRGVDDLASVVAGYLDEDGIAVDVAVDDHEAAGRLAVGKDRRGVHRDVDHALLDLLVERVADGVHVGLIPAALGGRGVKLDAAVVVHGRAAAPEQEQDDDGDDDDQADADADFLVRFLLRAFAFHALPPEFLSGARASA